MGGLQKVGKSEQTGGMPEHGRLWAPEEMLHKQPQAQAGKGSQMTLRVAYFAGAKSDTVLAHCDNSSGLPHDKPQRIAEHIAVVLFYQDCSYYILIGVHWQAMAFRGTEVHFKTTRNNENQPFWEKYCEKTF